MSRDTALAEARELKSAMSDWGVRCSIELQIGRSWPGDDWYSEKYLRMHHHTATKYKPGGNMTPALGICKLGRSDVPGPLCNGYGGYDLVYRIITLGLANHPGLGGPMTIDGITVPKNSARISTWGTEWEGGYQEWDTIPGMLEFMGKADNALADWMGRPVTSQMEHSTWTNRKIDRLHMTRAAGIKLTTKWRTQGSLLIPVLEDEMTFIKKRSNGFTAIVTGGKIIPVTGPNNWAEAEKGGVPCVVLDDDEYDRIVGAFPVVK